MLDQVIAQMVGKLHARIMAENSSCKPLLEHRSLFDTMSGISGLTPELAYIARSITSGSRLREQIDEIMGSILATTSSHLPQFLEGDGRPAWRHGALVGMAHGTAGIIAALVCLVQHARRQGQTGEVDSILALIDSVLDYDRANQLRHGWRDNRFSKSDVVPLNGSWCHGLAGLGMSRLSLLSIPEFRSVSESDVGRIAAMLATDDADELFDFYCCGKAGQVDFLFEAASRTGSADIFRIAELRAAKLYEGVGQDDSFRGLMGRTEPRLFPSLFQGAGGIAYALLRFQNGSLPSLGATPESRC